MQHWKNKNKMAAIFCQNHSMCEAPISVIVEILSKNDPLKYELISNEFKSLGLNQVKDLAKSSIGDVSKIPLDGEDSLFQLYDAMRVFDLQCDEQFKLAESEYHQGHYKHTEEMCLKLLLNQPKLEILLLLAASYFQSKEYDKSMEYYQKAYAINPDCAEVSNGLGVICFKKSQFEESIQHFLQAINLNYYDDTPKVNCASGYALMGYEEISIKAFLEILNYSPDLYKVRNNFGKVLLSFKHMADAKTQFKLALRQSKTFPDIWFNLGNMYYFEKKYEKSIYHFQRALELDPDFINAWINVGKIYFQLDRIHDAVNAFQNACRLSPNNFLLLQQMAYMYYIQDNKPLSIETYEKCLELEPNDEDSNLVMAFMLSEFDDTTNKKKAIKHFEKIIVMQPKNVDIYEGLAKTYMDLDEPKYASETYISLGDMHYDDDNLKNAYTAYMAANMASPENADSYWKMGLIAHRMGNDDEALEKYEEAKSLRPIFPNVYVDIALILEKKNLIDRAVEYYNMALIIEPNHENALLNLSNIKHKLGCLDEVVELYKKLVALDSSVAHTFNIKLAKILYKDIGNLNEAIVYYQKALAFTQNIADIYLDMGYVYLDLKKNDKAFFSFEMAFSLDSKCIIAKTNIGFIYRNRKNFTDAINEYEEILTIEPDLPDAYCNLVQCLQQVCDWSDYDIRISKLMNIVSNQLDTDCVPSLLPQYSLLYPFSLEVVKKISSKYAEQIVKKPYIARKLSQDHYIYSTLSCEKRLRVGYVSSDFGSYHAIAQLMRSIAKFHNGNEIEVFYYSISPNDNSASWSEISIEFANFRDFSAVSDIDAANQINNDCIHILVNMNGYTMGARNEIFALRPAPIQVSWLGYSGTSGATFIDYLITDKICSPPEFQCFYSEKFIYMNRSVFIGDHNNIFNDLTARVLSFSANSNQINGNIDIDDCGLNRLFASDNTSTPMYDISPDSSSPCHTRQKHNLPEGVVVYCNFSQLYKIVPSTFNMWATILRNVPNSVLWLLRFPPDGEPNLCKYAAEQNIDLSRIIFGDILKTDPHMRRIQLADIFLDTPLYNGRTTCLDALWTGTPVITLPGETFASRVAASLLTTLGYTNTIAANEKHYIEMATEIGLNKDLLKDIRWQMWKLKTESKLFDCKSYTQELENVYKEMWNNHNTNN